MDIFRRKLLRNKGKLSEKAILGMVVYVCNPSDWEAKTGGSEIEATLGYIVSSRPT
jgi:hypothetical protein